MSSRLEIKKEGLDFSLEIPYGPYFTQWRLSREGLSAISESVHE